MLCLCGLSIILALRGLQMLCNLSVGQQMSSHNHWKALNLSSVNLGLEAEQSNPFTAGSKGNTKWAGMKWFISLINHRNRNEADLCCSVVANSQLHWLLTRLLLSRRQHRTSVTQWQPPVIPQHTNQYLSVGITPKAHGNLAAALKWAEQHKAKHLLVGWE